MEAQAKAVMDYITQQATLKQTCLRKAVGCGLVLLDTRTREVMIAENSVNGVPSCRTNGVCSNETGRCGCLHAEIRLIVRLLREQKSYDRRFVRLLYCTYSPCTSCANAILEVGGHLFDGVVYDIATEHDLRGLEFLKSSMPVLQLKEVRRGNATIERWLQPSPNAR